MTGTVTGDRAEFVGRNGTLQRPAAMSRARLSGKLGATLDPCAAIQVPFDLFAGQEREITFRLGVGRSIEDAANLVHRHRGAAMARSALEAVWQYWNHTLGAVQVETPDPALDVLANGWLLYQTLACRMWARSGCYQSGGAFGFRDQLQDAWRLFIANHDCCASNCSCARPSVPRGRRPALVAPAVGPRRAHALFGRLSLAAARRLSLHTRHRGHRGARRGHPLHRRPSSQRRKRTRTTTCPGAPQKVHAVRALHARPVTRTPLWRPWLTAYRVGRLERRHELRGRAGQGESVWLGFFLYDVLERFAELARRHGDLVFAERCQSEAAQLRRNIEASGWDGQLVPTRLL